MPVSLVSFAAAAHWEIALDQVAEQFLDPVPDRPGLVNRCVAGKLESLLSTPGPQR